MYLFISLFIPQSLTDCFTSVIFLHNLLEVLNDTYTLYDASVNHGAL